VYLKAFNEEHSIYQDSVFKTTALAKVKHFIQFSGAGPILLKPAFAA